MKTLLFSLLIFLSVSLQAQDTTHLLPKWQIDSIYIAPFGTPHDQITPWFYKIPYSERFDTTACLMIISDTCRIKTNLEKCYMHTSYGEIVITFDPDNEEAWDWLHMLPVLKIEKREPIYTRNKQVYSTYGYEVTKYVPFSEPVRYEHHCYLDDDKRPLNKCYVVWVNNLNR